VSGADPNMQNMPRGGTFPVKKVFVSRFDGGKIMEADFAQLEFRAAAYLSQDGVAIDEVSNGFDVHAYTAKVITDAGQPTDRQSAKAHTFAPLYGATGFGRRNTQIKNYPVQSFATADIVPIALLHIDTLLKDKKSCIVNTVHDSIVIDVHPEEEQQVINVIDETNNVLPQLIATRWGINFNVPLLLEAKIGPNWLDTKDVA
jgi:DNA polymerase I-like protein with 3'-5' exonuclease and polymerase domains